jgi:4-diphosphocytidyl-2-C-methyl-D-erythritol kinase
MIVYPNAKINLGLNILKRREDGYHDISSILYPVKQCVDILEIVKSEKFKFTNTGIEIPYGENLCVKAWKILRSDFDISNVKIHLHKQIPIGAGLGGGSSDASFTLKELNRIFNLKLSNKELEKYALRLGADCPFFIDNTPKLVKGVGDQMTNIDLNLEDYEIRLVDPGIHVSTKEAYSKVVPRIPNKSVEEYINLDLSQWKGKLKNDFENSVFEKYPNLKTIKEGLYNEGYIYVSMSGSGSVIFSIR